MFMALDTSSLKWISLFDIITTYFQEKFTNLRYTYLTVLNSETCYFFDFGFLFC